MGLSASDTPVIEALHYFGASAEDIEQWTPKSKDRLILPEEMRNLVQIFWAIQSQWQWSHQRVIGLNYAGVQAYLELSQGLLSSAEFARLQRLENICLKLFDQTWNKFEYR